MPDLWLVFLGGSFLIISIFLFLLTLKYYQLALFLICFSPWISAVSVDQGSDGGPSIGSFIRIGLLFVLAFSGLTVFVRNFADNFKVIPTQVYLLLLFIVFAISSTIYSLDPQYTFIRSITFLAIFCNLLGIYTWVNSKKRLNILFNTMFYVIVVFTLVNLASFVIPDISWYFYGGYRFMGLWGHPNVLGSLSLISYPVLLWKMHDSFGYIKILIALLIAVVFVMHFLTGSRGSLVAAFIGIFIWLIIMHKYISGFSFISFLIIVVFMIINLKPGVFKREDDSGYLMGSTGRIDFWQAAAVLIKERPLHGYGYEVEGKVWQDPRFNEPDLFLWSGTARSSLHNGYISLLISLGFSGFLLWLSFVFYPFLKGFFISMSTYKAFVLSIMSSCLALNFIETVIVGNGAIAALFFWISWTVLNRLLIFAKHEKPLLTKTIN